jgi:hypothetical protein
MYVVLTKNANNTWDAIHELNMKQGTDISTLLDSAIEKGVPLVGMNVTPYKSKAVKGSVWNGSSFSGGTPAENVPSDTDEKWNTIEKYSFLSDNEIVISFTINNDDAKSAMFKAAFAGETVLVKNMTKPLDKIGKTFTLDGLELTLVLPA